MERGVFPAVLTTLKSGMPATTEPLLKPLICGLPASISTCRKSGNIKAYREGLVEKIGEAAVQGLDNDNRIHRWTIEELEAIRLQAYADLRALKKTLEAA